MTRSMTTSLTKINLGAIAIACLALTNARAVPIHPTVDPNSSPGTAPYVWGNGNHQDPAGPPDNGNYVNRVIGSSLGGSTTYRSEYFFGSHDGWGDDRHWQSGWGDDQHWRSGWGGDQHWQSGWQRDHQNPCEQVPDGGSTASLLGLGLLGLGLMLRCFAGKSA